MLSRTKKSKDGTWRIPFESKTGFNCHANVFEQNRDFQKKKL